MYFPSERRHYDSFPVFTFIRCQLVFDILWSTYFDSYLKNHLEQIKMIEQICCKKQICCKIFRFRRFRIRENMLWTRSRSGCYHVCPNHTNFQFDTAFMYTISILILLKIYQTRHPDINANAYSAFGVLAFIIFIGVIGVLHGNVLFWVLFSGLHISSCLVLSFQVNLFVFLQNRPDTILLQFRNKQRKFSFTCCWNPDVSETSLESTGLKSKVRDAASSKKMGGHVVIWGA